MNATFTERAGGRWPLAGKTARDLMTPNPRSIHGGATVPEVVAFLTDTGYSAAPVIDDAGHPIGVVSRTDIVVYDRARYASLAELPSYYDRADLSAPPVGEAADTGHPVLASDLMTPTVFSVRPDTSADEVVERMVDLNVHRLFVVDHDNVLVGVISVLDLLRQFRR
jgi:CBS domain-containing protein